MISDNQTNQLYLADCLPRKQTDFFKRFERVLNRCSISYEFLPECKDIWAVDFMPVLVRENSFVQFVYNPDYLQQKKYRKTISDVSAICKRINLKILKSNLILDGGNVSKTTDKVIMCEKVFTENQHLKQAEVVKQLEQLFQVDKIYFVPWDKTDFTGHADGMVRFIDNSAVLINDYSKVNRKYQRQFRRTLENSGFDLVEIPYNPPYDPTFIGARGLYLNFLQMNQAIIVPIFKTRFDEKAIRIIKDVFICKKIEVIECNKLADEGGLLNCISWNIKV
jgi:agmatine deiminase